MRQKTDWDTENAGDRAHLKPASPGKASDARTRYDMNKVVIVGTCASVPGKNKMRRPTYAVPAFKKSRPGTRATAAFLEDHFWRSSPQEREPLVWAFPTFQTHEERLAYLKKTPKQRSQWVRDVTQEGIEPNPGWGTGDSGKAPRAKRKCFNCQEYVDHIAQDCPKPKRGGKGSYVSVVKRGCKGAQLKVSEELTRQFRDLNDQAAGAAVAAQECVEEVSLVREELSRTRAVVDQMVAAANATLAAKPDDVLAKSIVDLMPAGVPCPITKEDADREREAADKKAALEKEFEELVDKELRELGEAHKEFKRTAFKHHDPVGVVELTPAQFVVHVLFALSTVYLILWALEWAGAVPWWFRGLLSTYSIQLGGGFVLSVPLAGALTYRWVWWLFVFLWVNGAVSWCCFHRALRHRMRITDTFLHRGKLREYLRSAMDLRPDSHSLGELKHKFLKPAQVVYDAHYVTRCGRLLDELLKWEFFRSIHERSTAIWSFLERGAEARASSEGWRLWAAWAAWFVLFAARPFRSCTRNVPAYYRGKPRSTTFEISLELSSQFLHPGVLVLGAKPEVITQRLREMARGTHSVNINRYAPLQAEYLVAWTQKFCYAVWADQERRTEMAPFPVIPSA